MSYKKLSKLREKIEAGDCATAGELIADILKDTAIEENMEYTYQCGNCPFSCKKIVKFKLRDLERCEESLKKEADFKDVDNLRRV